MEKGNEVFLSTERLPHEHPETKMSCRSQYGIPDNYHPEDHPPVKFRNHSNADRSETQRKRRSKNRLSNRRSTGYVSPEMVDEALQMGPDPKTESESK